MAAKVSLASLLNHLIRPTPLCSLLGKTIFFSSRLSLALKPRLDKLPNPIPFFVPWISLTFELMALKSWSLNQTFLLLNSNYSGYYWFKIRCIMIAVLILMVISFIVLYSIGYGGKGIKFLNFHSILCLFMTAKDTYLSDTLFFHLE